MGRHSAVPFVRQYGAEVKSRAKTNRPRAAAFKCIVYFIKIVLPNKKLCSEIVSAVMTIKDFLFV